MVSIKVNSTLPYWNDVNYVWFEVSLVFSNLILKETVQIAMTISSHFQKCKKLGGHEIVKLIKTVIDFRLIDARKGCEFFYSQSFIRIN